jgi:hypothetical protein
MIVRTAKAVIPLFCNTLNPFQILDTDNLGLNPTRVFQENQMKNGLKK